MMGRVASRILFAATVVAVLTAGVSILFSQARQGQPSPRSIPRLPDGKPDFSGFWSNPVQPGARGAATVFTKSKMAPFVPGGEALFYEPRTGDPRHDEPRAFCMPSGFPSGFFGPYPIQIVQSKDYLVLVTIL